MVASFHRNSDKVSLRFDHHPSDLQIVYQAPSILSGACETKAHTAVEPPASSKTDGTVAIVTSGWCIDPVVGSKAHSIVVWRRIVHISAKSASHQTSHSLFTSGIRYPPSYLCISRQLRGPVCPKLVEIHEYRRRKGDNR